MCSAGGDLKGLILKGNKHGFEGSRTPSQHSLPAQWKESSRLRIFLVSVTEDVVFLLLNAYKHQHYLVVSRTNLPSLLDIIGRQNSFSSSVFMSLEVRRKAELHLRDQIWAGKKSFLF